MAKRRESCLLSSPAFLFSPSQLYCFVCLFACPDLVRGTKLKVLEGEEKRDGEKRWKRQWRQWRQKCDYDEMKGKKEGLENSTEKRTKNSEICWRKKSLKEDEKGNLPPPSLLASFVLGAYISEGARQNGKISSNHQIWCSRIFPQKTKIKLCFETNGALSYRKLGNWDNGTLALPQDGSLYISEVFYGLFFATVIIYYIE